MKLKYLLLAFLPVMNATVWAQTSREEIFKNTHKAAGNYYSYDNRRHKVTKAPEGYTPFYITHYGRHGSRYMMSNGEYKYVMKWMLA